jgi:hypothetical protein
MDGALFTTSSIRAANEGYKKLYYGLKNLPIPKKEAMEKISIEAWEKLKKERGIKSQTEPARKKSKA